jgi:hypothetical protein
MDDYYSEYPHVSTNTYPGDPNLFNPLKIFFFWGLLVHVIPLIGLYFIWLMIIGHVVAVIGLIATAFVWVMAFRWALRVGKTL